MTFRAPRPASTLLFLLVAVGSTATARAQVSTTPSTLDWASTIYSIGVEWRILGDSNTNATASLDYRVRGETAWSAALPLVRVEFNGASTLAGSILFLWPGTTYEVRVSLSDPDGGAETRVLTASTRALPSPPTQGRTLHVVPGTGGGDGSAANPFRGIGAAQSAAQPGDTLLLHAGAYGGRVQFTKSGTDSAYIAWKAFGDGEALLNGITVSGSHVWLEGLTVRNQSYGLLSAGNPDDVVVSRCTFYGNHYAIFMMEGGRNWYIADNAIVGDTPYTTGSFDGEGIDLNGTGGHTVAHNRVSSVADGISYPAGNVDIFGNDIFDTSDDGIEADYAGANLRIWGNRIHNAVHNGISFQPQGGAPWYILRNQIVGNVEAALKFRTTDRFVLLHNTVVNWGTAWPGDAMMCCNEDHLLRSFSRNNIWVSIQGGQIWGFDAGVVDWRTSLDYDAFDWGSHPAPFAYGGSDRADISALTAASGLEPHGVRLSKDTCFTSFDIPGPPPVPIPAQVLALRSGCAAVDAGAVLPNVNAGRFAGPAPDIGAFEYGHPAPAFGPRPPGAPDAPAAPSDLTATAASSSEIDLAWADNSSNETGFAIEQSTAGGAFVQIATVGANVTGLAATGLAASTSYAYRVRAFNGSAWSAYSPTAAATTLPVTGGGSTPFTGTPVTLPGTIQIENFDNGAAGVAYHDASPGNSGGAYRATDVDIESTTDTGAGYNIGYVSAGEWLKYTVSVATAGSYTIEVRVASPGTGGAFHLESDGMDKTGTLSVPATGGWQGWTTIRRTGVALAAGTQVLRLVMDAAPSGGGAVGNFNWIRVTAETDGGSTPFTGTPVALPGTIQAENFDNGAAGVAYHDASPGNSGGAYRATDVDIESTTDTGAGYNIGYVSAGEWLKYTVTVATAGTYTVEVRVASPGTGGTFHLESDGVDKTGTLSVPATGGWQGWTTIRRTGVALAAGTQVLRLVMDAAPSGGGAVGNFNWIRVTAESGGGSTPFTGTPVALPGTIQAEDFDNGAAGVAYHDASPGNSGGAYRATDVDIESTTDTGGGYNVGYVSAGEWLKYTVSVATAGTYIVEVRVASPGNGGTFHLESNGVDKTGALSLPATGGWQAWATVRRAGVTLAAGTQVLRLVMDAAPSGGGAVGNFNWIRVTAESDGGSTPFTGTPVALPGTIQAENFDNGAAGAAYHDTTAGNSGAMYRATDVDVQPTADTGGGYNVGWVSAGEWLKYTVSVASAGNYAVELRVASPGAGGTLHLEVNGVDVTGPLSVPATGGWQAWATVRRAGVTLPAGTQVLRLVMDSPSAGGGAVGNVNWIRVF